MSNITHINYELYTTTTTTNNNNNNDNNNNNNNKFTSNINNVVISHNSNKAKDLHVEVLRASQGEEGGRDDVGRGDRLLHAPILCYMIV